MALILILDKALEPETLAIPNLLPDALLNEKPLGGLAISKDLTAEEAADLLILEGSREIDIGTHLPVLALRSAQETRPANDSAEDVVLVLAALPVGGAALAGALDAAGDGLVDVDVRDVV